MPDLAFVLEMCNHFSLAGQRPHKASSVRCGVLLWRLHMDLRLVNQRRRLINGGHQKFYKPVHHILIVVIIADLKSVVKENVGCGRENSSGYRLCWRDIRFVSRLEKGPA